MRRRSPPLYSGSSKPDRPAVLYLTNNLPCPPTSGGQLREYQLLRRLSARFTVHLIAFVSNKAQPAATEASLAFLASITEVVTNPSTAPAGMPLRMRLHYAPRGADIVRSIFQRYRFLLVHVQGYFLMHYLERIPQTPVVLATENIEFALEEQAETLGYRDFNAAATRVVEIDAWRRANVCVCVTPEDAEVVRQYVATVPVRCVAGGVDHVLDVPRHKPDCSQAGTCLYVANFSWAPSRDAAVHLLRDIWPAISRLVPESRLVLAGYGIDSSLSAEAAQTKGVTLYGEYGTFAEVASTAALFVFPMRFGGGIKVKIIEAIGAGLPIVTTTAALRGLPQEIRQHIWLADSPQAFAEMAAQALAQVEDRTTRANSARLLLTSLMPTWADLACDLAAIWQCALKEGQDNEEVHTVSRAAASGSTDTTRRH